MSSIRDHESLQLYPRIWGLNATHESANVVVGQSPIVSRDLRVSLESKDVTDASMFPYSFIPISNFLAQLATGST